MSSTKRLLSLAALIIAVLAAKAPASAQDAAPQPTATPSLLDRQYDGNLHVTLAPYLWLPTMNSEFTYSVPGLRRLHGPGATISGNTSVGPSQYLANLNSAAMFAVDARKGNFDIFADYIYVNLSASAATSVTITGPRGRLQIPARFSTDARLASSIWEAAAGYTVARGHNADLSVFWGIRSLPANLTLGYNATVGRRGLIAPSGTISNSSYLSSTIFGLRGKAFLGDSRWFVPYYADIGSSINQIGNTTWEAYSGLGYGFNHGQTLLVTYRSLNYNDFPPDRLIQKLDLHGPLLGYTFNL
ncbi:MAG: hypothetical protein WA814_00380 [Candidatus Baltobacteraceae bacterium]